VRAWSALVLFIALALCAGCESTEFVDVEGGRDPIRIAGSVHEWMEFQGTAMAYGPGVPDATVSTSLDDVTTTTDARGAFSLETVTQKPPGCFEYTVTVTAPGRPTVSVTGDWGETVTSARFAMNGATQMVAHCY
jgi:hypothetical protein